MIKEILGRKLGMTQIFTGEGEMIGVSVVEVEPVCILEKIVYPTKMKAKIGAFRVEDHRVNKVKKPILGYFKKLGVGAYKIIKEVEVEGEDIPLREKVGIDIFQEGELVSVRGKSKGRGFQGGMKRWGWSGQPLSHGSTTHRRIGSSGASTYPARVIKGHRMPGHMGARWKTVRNLKILRVDKENKVLFIKGAIPGHKNSIVLIKKK